MEIINNKEDAYKLAFPYLKSKNANANEQLKNTLEYIFDVLAHACYMLCINDNNILFCKLEHKNTPPILKEIVKEELANLQKNAAKKGISKKQIERIKEYTKNIDKLRLLQCVLKQIKGNSTVSKEYDEFIRSIPMSMLPRGVFILNLTDAVIVRKDGKYPFAIFSKSSKSKRKSSKSKSKSSKSKSKSSKSSKSNNSKMLPIYSLSGQKGYTDITIPNYDDVMYIMGYAKYNIKTDFVIEWKDKTDNRAVFRGGASGCGYTKETNQRIKLAAMGPLNPKYLDVGIAVANEGKMDINSLSIKFDPVYGLGMANTNIQPVSRLSYYDQSKYKYIIHVDGNVNAYRLLATMAMGSLLLRVDSEYTSWVDDFIEHGKHYVRVKADLSNLIQIIKWFEKEENKKKAKKIAHNGLKFARKALTKEFVINTFVDRLSANTR